MNLGYQEYMKNQLPPGHRFTYQMPEWSAISVFAANINTVTIPTDQNTNTLFIYVHKIAITIGVVPASNFFDARFPTKPIFRMTSSLFSGLFEFDYIVQDTKLVMFIDNSPATQSFSLYYQRISSEKIKQ